MEHDFHWFQLAVDILVALLYVMRRYTNGRRKGDL